MKRAAILGVTVALGLLLTACDIDSAVETEPATEQKQPLRAAEATNIKKTTQYLEHSMPDKTHFKKATTTKDILNIELKDYSLKGKSSHNQNEVNLVKILQAASKLPTASKGVTLLQTDDYTHNGKKKELLSFAIYYSRANLDKLNFEELQKKVENTPKNLLLNATEYYLDHNYQQNNDHLTGLTPAKLTDSPVMPVYMDTYHIHFGS